MAEKRRLKTRRLKRSKKITPELEDQMAIETQANGFTRAIQDVMLADELERLRIYQGEEEVLSEDWESLKDVVSDLHYAAFAGDVTSVKRIIEEMRLGNRFQGVDQRTEHGPKLLKETRREGGEHYGQENYAGFFLGTTPLMMASQQGHVDVVKYLLELGANVDVSDTLGFTALSLACAFNRVAVAKYLLKKQAHPNVPEIRSGMTPLILACVNNQVETAKLLINRRAPDSMADRYGRQAIHYAAWNYNWKLVELLNNQQQVNINATDHHGNTPLHLLVSDLGVDLEDVDDNKALDVQRISTVFQYLQQYGGGAVDMKRESRRGTCKLGEECECLVQMLQMGASLFTRNDIGQTVLHVLCARLTPVVYSQGFLYIEEPPLTQTLLVMLKILISKGSPTKLADSQGMTALALSIRQHNWLAVKYLSRDSVVRADVNVQKFRSLSETVAAYGWGSLFEVESFEKTLQFMSAAVLYQQNPCKTLKMAKRIMDLSTFTS